MKGKSAVHSHETDEWGTPQDIFDDLDRTGRFQLDPACTRANAKCNICFPIDEGYDGLKQPWHVFASSVFVNPPHSKIAKWVEKAVLESLEKGCSVTMLITARTGTDWWHDLVLPHAYEILEVRHRIYFEGNKKGPAPFDSAIVRFNGYQNRWGPIRKSYTQPRDRT